MEWYLPIIVLAVVAGIVYFSIRKKKKGGN
ncbi:hypothetical protein ES708_11939 [subsurface metagenome]